MEMIYVVLLLYDDVIDVFFLWCGIFLVLLIFGNKFFIFFGDFLLGCVFVVFVCFGFWEVVELFVIVIVNFVEGEVM